MRRHLPAAFFFACTLAISFDAPAQNVGKTRDGATNVSRAEALGAMHQALRDDARPFTDELQQKSLVDALIDFKTVPSRAQARYKFTETESGYIARQVGEANLRAIAQLVDWRYRLAHKPDSPHVLLRARELYAAQTKELLTAPSFELSHIVVRTDTRSIEEATTRAITAYDRLNKGELFEKVALELSDDPSVKSNKGALPPLTGDLVDNAFARNALREDLVGKLLRPFLARSGIHVVLIRKYNPPTPLAFEQVRESLIAKAIEEVIANERIRDWNAVRVQDNDREYDLTSLVDLIKPKGTETSAEKLRLEAARIKSEMLQKKNLEKKPSN